MKVLSTDESNFLDFDHEEKKKKKKKEEEEEEEKRKKNKKKKKEKEEEDPYFIRNESPLDRRIQLPRF
ncbi:hypothetical protein HZU67_09872 [Apis mellifera carnica]|nr:hypothetical protein HZU67_09872 [Apis mellifera carnica]